MDSKETIQEILKPFQSKNDIDKILALREEIALSKIKIKLRKS